jgi:hypothetical protein
MVDFYLEEGVSVRPTHPGIETGHAIGAVGVLGDRSEVKFPDYLRGGGLRDLLHFSRRFGLHDATGALISNSTLVLESWLMLPPHAEKSLGSLSQNRLATMVLSSIWKMVARE